MNVTQPKPLVDMLESYLSVTLSREKMISMNMANVDTPGYHTKDINFQGELSRAMQKSSGDWQTEQGKLSLTPVAQEVPGLMERADGNNVDIDREGMVLAQTQLQYEMGISLIKNEFHQILSAINGGN
jgi:flagellar basal-body rod protein FlgB